MTLLTPFVGESKYVTECNSEHGVDLERKSKITAVNQDIVYVYLLPALNHTLPVFPPNHTKYYHNDTEQ